MKLGRTREGQTGEEIYFLIEVCHLGVIVAASIISSYHISILCFDSLVHKLCNMINSQPHALRFRYLISWGGLNALAWIEGRPRRDGAILFQQCLVGRS